MHKQVQKNISLKNRIKNIVVLITLFLLLTQISSFAAKTGVDINFAGVSARSIAMGNASTAITENAEAIFVNPAGIATTRGWSFTSMSTKLMETVDYQMLGGTYATSVGVFGLGYLGAQSPAGYYTTDQASVNAAPSMAYADRLLFVSYAASLNNTIKVPDNMGELYVGANLKCQSKGLSGGFTNSGSGYSSDLGLLVKANENTSFGVSLQNVISSLTWTSGAQEKIESAAKIGVAHRFEIYSEKVLVSADLHTSSLSNAPMTYHVGAEYKPMNILALRIGLDQVAAAASSSTVSTATNLTAGVGLNLAGVSFDYAYHQDSSLSQNNCHYFSLSYAPETINKRSVQKPVVNTEVKTNLPELNYASALDKKVENKNSNKSKIVMDADLAKLMEISK
ncbi:MAG: hypothetical protein NT099_00805 [Candidatus Saganbacteria bacterium]|nr:hypothetical protein [Candidatus Saganbacteria bacterium]